MPNIQAGPVQSPSTTTDPREREKYILGKPPRLSPLKPEERSEKQQQLIERVGAPSYLTPEQKAKINTEWLEILVRHPDLLVAHLAMAQKFMAEGELTARDRELAILRLSWLSQAPFLWGAHVSIGKTSGITAEEIERVIQGSTAAGWRKYDRALVRAVEELHYSSMISDETWADLAETLNDKQLIELVMLMGQYKTVAYYQNTLRFRLTEGNEGLSAR